MPQVSESKYLVMAGWNDVPHLDERTKRELLDSTPSHMREARSRGIPVLGSGRIFPIDEDTIKEPIIQIPEHWARLAAIDFGWDHPTAGAWGAWDRDSDVVHIYDAYKLSEATPIIHAATFKAKGDWIPVAWPHDGLQHDKGSGVALADQYRKLGVNMLKHQATHPPGPGQEEGQGGNGVEAGIMEMLNRMQTGRLKVAAHLEVFFEEFRLYHRKDGKIVKEFDDVISAVRYLIMMLRFARVKPVKKIAGHSTFRPLDAEIGL